MGALATHFFGIHIDLLLEIREREKEAGILPEVDIDTYMKVSYKELLYFSRTKAKKDMYNFLFFCKKCFDLTINKKISFSMKIFIIFNISGTKSEYTWHCLCRLKK